MQIKIIVPRVYFLLFLVFVGSACTPQANIASASNSSATLATTRPADQPASRGATTTVLPSPIPTTTAAISPTIPSEIDEQFAQAVQAARTRLQQSLQGTALQEAEKGLLQWDDVNRGEVEYMKTHGEVTINAAGKQVFTGQTAVVFKNMLADLEIGVESTIKWANFQERAPEQRQAAAKAVGDYSGQEVTYKGTVLWPFNWLLRVENYHSGGYVYSVDVETDRIVEIEPINDMSIPSSGSGVAPEVGRKEAEEIIKRLAPEVDLGRLTYNEAVSPGYYLWEDHHASLLNGAQYRKLQVVFGPDGTFASFINSLSAAP